MTAAGGGLQFRDRWERVVRDDPRVERTTLLVLLLAATYANRDGSSVRVGVRTLAECSGLAEPTIRRGLSEARDLGYLYRVSRGHRSGDLAVSDEHRLSMPFPTVLTSAHQRAVDTRTTDQNGGHQRSKTASPVLASEHQQGSTRNYKMTSRPDWCGRCDEQTRQMHTPDLDEQGRVVLCSVCHPRAAS